LNTLEALSKHSRSTLEARLNTLEAPPASGLNQRCTGGYILHQSAFFESVVMDRLLTAAVELADMKDDEESIGGGASPP
jgi:hypothetical protein